MVVSVVSINLKPTWQFLRILWSMDTSHMDSMDRWVRSITLQWDWFLHGYYGHGRILSGRVGRMLARHADGAGSIPGGSIGDLFLGSLQRMARSLYKHGVVLLNRSLSVRIMAPKNLIHTYNGQVSFCLKKDKTGWALHSAHWSIIMGEK